MANFCAKCGTRLDIETGLCPQCDYEKINTTKYSTNFCMKCGTKLNPDKTCPACTEENTKNVSDVQPEAETVEPITEETTEQPEITEINTEPETTNQSPSLHEAKAATVVETIPPTPNVAPTPVLKKKKKKISAIEVVATIFLSFLLFITTLLAVTVIGVRHTISESGIEKILDNIDHTEIVNIVYEESKDDLRIYLNENYNTNLTNRDIDKFISKTNLKGEIAEKLSDYFSDVLTDSNDFSLTADDAFEFIYENRNVFEEISGVELGYEQCYEIANNTFDKEFIESISPYEIKNDNETVISLISTIFSKTTVIILIILCLVWILTMIRNNVSQAALGSGIVFILIGGITSTAALTMGKFYLYYGIPKNIGSIIGSLLYANISIFAGVLVIGIAFLVLRAVTRKIIFVVKTNKASKKS